MGMIYKEVEIGLQDFDDQDLIDELYERGVDGFNDSFETNVLLNKIYEARRLGNDYQGMLDQYIYMTLGKIM